MSSFGCWWIVTFSSILKAGLGQRWLKCKGLPLFLTPYNLARIVIFTSPHPPPPPPLPSKFRHIEEFNLRDFSRIASYPASLQTSDLMLAGKLGITAIEYICARKRGKKQWGRKRGWKYKDEQNTWSLSSGDSASTLVSKTIIHYPNSRENTVDINCLYYDS